MNKSNEIFRDKLLSIEKTNSTLREKYEWEVRAMVEKKLTGLRKLGTVASLLMGLCFFVLFGALAVFVPKEFPMWGRAIWAAGSVFGLAFAGLAVLVLKRGTINLKTDNMAMARLGWGFIVIVATITLVFSGQLPDRSIAIEMLVSLLIFEVAAAVGLLKAIIERSEVKTREKLLEIEYHLADISEKMEEVQAKS